MKRVQVVLAALTFVFVALSFVGWAVHKEHDRAAFERLAKEKEVLEYENREMARTLNSSMLANRLGDRTIVLPSSMVALQEWKVDWRDPQGTLISDFYVCGGVGEGGDFINADGKRVGTVMPRATSTRWR